MSGDKAASGDKAKKTLSLGKTLGLKGSSDLNQVRQNFSHGRSKSVEVEVKRRRTRSQTDESSEKLNQNDSENIPDNLQGLTNDELDARMRALKSSLVNKKEDDLLSENSQNQPEDIIDKEQGEPSGEESVPSVEVSEAVKETTEEDNKRSDAPTPRAPRRMQPKRKKISIDDLLAAKPIVYSNSPAEKKKRAAAAAAIVAAEAAKKSESAVTSTKDGIAEAEAAANSVTTRKRDHAPKHENKPEQKKLHDVKSPNQQTFAKRLDRRSLNRALSGEDAQRTRSEASYKRARRKQHRQNMVVKVEVAKVIRDVVIPETIMVSELASRMTERGADVIKALMKLGMMVTINQVIDADTAELICTEFGHKFKRTTETDMEDDIIKQDDKPEDRITRCPVVTVMGHVDHGKTSLLDAMRATSVASGEAGGITQHIGAYQVKTKSGKEITFIDTPGHAAFSEMRARGANITDVVVLVVAADDGIMEQTIEAINHAKAAGVSIIIAINKIDKPEANIEKVKSDLLSHDIILEEYGGEIIAVGVSAKTGENLNKLEETILLQAEMRELKANPTLDARGVVIEAKIDKGRGMMATVLINQGTLRVGDIFVSGSEWGKVRALTNDLGQKVKEATPGMPVEVIGLNGVPLAGDDFTVVGIESEAREIAEDRHIRHKNEQLKLTAKSSMDQFMSGIQTQGVKTLGIVIKTDVQGSLEAISSSLLKLGNDEVEVKLLHTGVGAINESDVTLATASGGLVFGFNVRANPQARSLSKAKGIDISYYSIIYNVVDDVKALLSGMLAPTLQEKFIGTAEIREIFGVPKIGKVAGCYVTQGMVKRGSKIRLLRDNVVIHEGDLKTLRRFKDEVKEVKESYECGMAFDSYQDIKIGDVIECMEVQEIQREL